MEQKRVSFKVAKALKEAGYPQEEDSITYIYCDGELMSLKVFYSKGRDFEELLNAPTYLDVWPWLWKVKDIKLSVAEIDDVVKAYIRGSKPLISQFSADPEGAIINIIEFLVDNDLIK